MSAGTTSRPSRRPGSGPARPPGHRPAARGPPARRALPRAPEAPRDEGEGRGIPRRGGSGRGARDEARDRLAGVRQGAHPRGQEAGRGGVPRGRQGLHDLPRPIPGQLNRGRSHAEGFGRRFPAMVPDARQGPPPLVGLTRRPGGLCRPRRPVPWRGPALRTARRTARPSCRRGTRPRRGRGRRRRACGRGRGPAITVRIAWARAGGLRSGTSRPVLPSSTTSVVPGAAVATTGLRNRIASSTTLGSPSYRLGRTSEVGGGQQARDVVAVAQEPDLARRGRRRARSLRAGPAAGPSPTIRVRRSGRTWLEQVERREQVVDPLLRRQPAGEEDQRGVGRPSELGADGRRDRPRGAPRRRSPRGSSPGAPRGCPPCGRSRPPRSSCRPRGRSSAPGGGRSASWPCPFQRSTAISAVTTTGTPAARAASLP